jgi:hypothetical protein
MKEIPCSETYVEVIISREFALKLLGIEEGGMIYFCANCIIFGFTEKLNYVDNDGQVREPIFGSYAPYLYKHYLNMYAG